MSDDVTTPESGSGAGNVTTATVVINVEATGAAITEKLHSGVAPALEAALTSIKQDSTTIHGQFLQVEKMINALANRRVAGKNPATTREATQFKEMLAQLSGVVSELYRVDSKGHALAPTPSNIMQIDSVVGELTKLAGKLIPTFGKSVGLSGKEKIDPSATLANINRVATQYVRARDAYAAQVNALVVDRAAIAGQQRLLGPSRGLTFDIETANKQGDIWGIALKDAAKAETVLLKRRVAEFGGKIDKFNKDLVGRALPTTGGNLGLGQMLVQFKNMWEESGGGAGSLIPGRLPALRGQNVSSDIGQLIKATSEVIASKTATREEIDVAKFLQPHLNSLVRLVPDAREPGKQKYELVESQRKNDSMYLFSNLLKELGFASQPGSESIDKLPGKTLSNIAAALRNVVAPLRAHDPVSDTVVAEDIVKLLSSSAGVNVAKRMFDVGAWKESVKKSLDQRSFLSYVEGGFKEGSLPKGMYDSRLELYDLVSTPGAQVKPKSRAANFIETAREIYKKTSSSNTASLNSEHAPAARAQERFDKAIIGSLLEGTTDQLGITTASLVKEGKQEAISPETVRAETLKKYAAQISSISEGIIKGVGYTGGMDVNSAAYKTRVETAVINQQDKIKQALLLLGTETELTAIEEAKRIAGGIADVVKAAAKHVVPSAAPITTRLAQGMGKTEDELVSTPQATDIHSIVTTQLKPLFDAKYVHREPSRGVIDLSPSEVNRMSLYARSISGDDALGMDLFQNAQAGNRSLVKSTISTFAAKYGDRYEKQSVGFIQKYFSDRYEMIHTLDEQQTVKLGSLTGHLDALVKDKKTGMPAIGEFKTRSQAEYSLVDSEAAIREQQPSWIAQASLYAMGLGLFDPERPAKIPTKFFVGNLGKYNDILEAAEQDHRNAAALPETDPTRAAKFAATLKARDEARKQAELHLQNVKVIDAFTDPDLQMGAALDRALTEGRSVKEVLADVAPLTPETRRMFGETLGITGKKLEKTPDDVLRSKLIDFYRTTPAPTPTTEVLLAAGSDIAKTPINIGGYAVPGIPGYIPERQDLGTAVTEGLKEGFATHAELVSRYTAGPGGPGGPGGGLPPDEIPPIRRYSGAEKLALAEKLLANKLKVLETLDLGLAAEGKVAGSVLDKDSLKDEIRQKTLSVAGFEQLVEELRAQQIETPEDYSSRGTIADRAREILASTRQSLSDKAADQAAQIKAFGLTGDNFKAAMGTAQMLQQFYPDAKAGYSQASLARLAAAKGVQVVPELKDVTQPGKVSAALSGLLGEDTSFAKRERSFKLAADAVNNLFKQLASHKGDEFLSDEIKQINEFIEKSQEAQNRANSFKHLAGMMRSSSEMDLAAAGKAKTPEEEAEARRLAEASLKQAQRFDTQAQRASEEALAFANKAKAGVKVAPVRTVAEVDEDIRSQANKELEQLKATERALLEKRRDPTYRLNTADLDAMYNVRQRIGNIESGTSTTPKQFSYRDEYQAATNEYQDFKARLQESVAREAVVLKVRFEAEGGTVENLRALLKNQLTATRLGASPSDEFHNLFRQALDSNVGITGANLMRPQMSSYYQSMSMAAESKTPFSSLQAGVKMASDTVDELKLNLSRALPEDKGILAADKKMYSLEKAARQAVMRVGEVTALQAQYEDEMHATNDASLKETRRQQILDLNPDLDNRQADAEAAIAAYEAEASKRRAILGGADAYKAQYREIQNNLQLEKESLLVDQRRLSTILSMDNGKHYNTDDAKRLLDINKQLAEKHGVYATGAAGGGLTNAQIFSLGKGRGFTQGDILQTGQGRTKDFVGGAIDLMDWQLQWIGGVTVLNAFSSAIKNSFGFAVQFEAEMRNIQLITKANTADMAELTAELTGLATQFQYSASELGQGLVILGQAGFDAYESMKLLPGITKLATATMSDLKTAADVTTTIIEAFNIPVADSGPLSDTLAAMTIESKLDLEKLGTSFNYVASAAATAGFSIEETGTAMGLMSNAGVRASTIGTSLRSIIGALMSPTAKFASALGAVGLSVEDVSPTTNNLGEIFNKLHNAGFDVESAFDGLDKRIAGGIVTLIEAAGQFDEFQNKITNSGRASQMAQGQMDTLAAQVKRLGNAFQLLGNDWFSGNLEGLKLMAEKLATVTTIASKGANIIPSGIKSGINSTLVMGIIGSIGAGVVGGGLGIVGNIREKLNQEKANEIVATKAYDKYMEEARAEAKKQGISVSQYEESRKLKAQTEGKAYYAPVDPRTAERGYTLTGRNKSVYTTFTTLFDPKMMAYSAALTAASMLAAEAYDVLSGQDKIDSLTRLADTLDNQANSLERLSASLKGATEGTTEYYDAIAALNSLGIKDLTPDNLEANIGQLRIRKDIVNEQLFKAKAQKYNNPLYNATKYFYSEESIKEEDNTFAANIVERLKARGEFYSGTYGSILKETSAAGFAPDSMPVQQALRMAKSAQLQDTTGSAKRAEITAAFRAEYEKLVSFDKSMPIERAKYDEFLNSPNTEEFSKKNERVLTRGFSGFAYDALGMDSYWGPLAGIPRVVGETAGVISDRNRKTEELKSVLGPDWLDKLSTGKRTGVLDAHEAKIREENKRRLTALAEKYSKEVMGADDSEYLAGSQESATNRMLEKYSGVNKIQKQLDDVKAWSDDTPWKAETLDMLNSMLKSAKAEFMQAARRRALKVGFGNLPQNFIQTAVDFVEIITKGTSDGTGREVDKAGLDLFKGIPASALSGVQHKLAALTKEREVEESNLSSVFKDKDGRITQEMQVVMDLKYKIKAEQIVQAELDAAFKPLQTLFDKLNQLRAEQAKADVVSLESRAGRSMALGKLDVEQATVEERSKGLVNYGASSAVSDYTPVSEFISNVSADKEAVRKLAMEQENENTAMLASKQKYYTQLRELENRYNAEMEAFGMQVFANEEERNRRRLAIEKSRAEQTISINTEMYNTLKEKATAYQNIATSLSIQKERAQQFHAEGVTRYEKLREESRAAAPGAYGIAEAKTIDNMTGQERLDMAKDYFSKAEQATADNKLELAGKYREKAYSYLDKNKEVYTTGSQITIEDQLAMGSGQRALENLKKWQQTRGVSDDQIKAGEELASKYTTEEGRATGELTAKMDTQLTETNRILGEIRDILSGKKPVEALAKAEGGQAVEYKVNKDGVLVGTPVDKQTTGDAVGAATGIKEGKAERDYKNILAEASTVEQTDLERQKNVYTPTIADTAAGNVNTFVDGVTARADEIGKVLANSFVKAMATAKEEEVKKAQETQSKSAEFDKDKPAEAAKPTQTEVKASVTVKVETDHAMFKALVGETVVEQLNSLPA